MPLCMSFLLSLRLSGWPLAFVVGAAETAAFAWGLLLNASRPVWSLVLLAFEDAADALRGGGFESCCGLRSLKSARARGPCVIAFSTSCHMGGRSARSAACAMAA